MREKYKGKKESKQHPFGELDVERQEDETRGSGVNIRSKRIYRPKRHQP